MLENEYFLWGAGEYGKRVIDFLKNDLTFKAVIDNDPAKQGTLFHGLTVVSFDAIKHELPNVKIVIAMNIPTEVREFLLSKNYLEKRDFFTLQAFLPRYFWCKKRTVIKNMDIGATTICNRNCISCQTFMSMSVNNRHLSVEDVTNEVDLAFRHLDMVMNVNICIGESLLNKKLPEMCRVIHQKYEARYHTLMVQSNGTVLPDDDAMRTFSETKTLFSVSNYPENAKETEGFLERCDQYGVRYYYNSAGGNRKLWFDLGDPRFDNESNPEKLRKRFERCWQPGMFVHGGLLYLCDMQGYAYISTEAGVVEPGDVFDLSQPKTDATRAELYKIISQQPPDRGYISHCRRCLSVMNPAHYAST